jgi:4-diphosphocytidyl-2-C-methyl-D-erythritol kinase
MGGGSSDAAGLIRALQRLLPGKMADAEIKSVAAAVGADVPFFLVGGRAQGEGYGEMLTPLPDSPTRWLTIVKPPIGCPTGPAYSRLDSAPYDWRAFPSEDMLYNDFERVMPGECGAAIERLLSFGAADAGLTGSGSAVFGRFASRPEAEAARLQAETEGLGRAWTVPTLNRLESLQFDALA